MAFVVFVSCVPHTMFQNSKVYGPVGKTGIEQAISLSMIRIGEMPRKNTVLRCHCSLVSQHHLLPILSNSGFRDPESCEEGLPVNSKWLKEKGKAEGSC